MLTLYEVVANETQPGGAPYFSPFTIRARLALLHKGVEFDTRDVRYEDLVKEWKDKLGVEKATVPFIQREDGTYLMDSLKIAEWLEETYPDRPSLFQPDAAVPYDPKSEEHKAAHKACADFSATGPKALHFGDLFTFWAPKFAPTFTKWDFDYWTSDERLGQGSYQRMCDTNPETPLNGLKEGIAHVDKLLSASSDQKFLTSPSAPGYKDFIAFSLYRMIRAYNAELAESLWSKEHAGEKVGAWRVAMEEKYGDGKGGLKEIYKRDPR